MAGDKSSFTADDRYPVAEPLQKQHQQPKLEASMSEIENGGSYSDATRHNQQSPPAEALPSTSESTSPQRNPGDNNNNTSKNKSSVDYSIFLTSLEVDGGVKNALFLPWRRYNHNPDADWDANAEAAGDEEDDGHGDKKYMVFREGSYFSYPMRRRYKDVLKSPPPPRRLKKP